MAALKEAAAVADFDFFKSIAVSDQRKVCPADTTEPKVTRSIDEHR